MFGKTHQIVALAMLLAASAGAGAQSRSSAGNGRVSLSDVERQLAELRREIDAKNTNRGNQTGKTVAPATKAPASAQPVGPQAPSVQEQDERIAELENQIREQNALISRLIALQQQALQQQTPPESGSTEREFAPATNDASLALASELQSIAKANQDLQAKVAKLEAGHAASAKSGERLKGLGSFSFSGDIRGRYEPFFGGTQTSARHRARLRLRFSAKAVFNSELSGGFTIASGDASDPISTNQTFTNFFQRKFIGIDKAYIEYTPRWFKPLTITGGKFAFPGYRTEMTWDNDLNPEGLSQSLTFNLKNPVLKRIGIVAFQMPLLEVSAGKDSFVLGGQLETQWKLHDRVRLSAYAAFYDWSGTDAVRAAINSKTLGGASNSHAGTSTQYASQFGLFDMIARFDIKTGSSRWPMMAQFNFVTNTRACANVANIPAPQPVCNSRDRHGYWAEVQFGQAKERGDINFGYTFARIEREAVLGAFNFSDLRQPTNVASHRFNFGYQAERNVTFGFTGLFGRQLVTSTSGTKEPFLRRFQVDVNYKF